MRTGISITLKPADRRRLAALVKNWARIEKLDLFVGAVHACALNLALPIRDPVSLCPTFEWLGKSNNLFKL